MDDEYGDYLIQREKDRKADAYWAGVKAATKGQQISDINVSDQWAFNDIYFLKGYHSVLSKKAKELTCNLS